ncbi:MAG: DEAD/DEAH box helicase [Phycisphaerae bacterium]|nr:DEAD/DEAH box helicase [Phycisphaerae bacterium]
MPFASIGLSDPLVRGILATGYTAPTEIQSQAIPAALEGRDILGCAQTGTGKTAAFVLPILHLLSHRHPQWGKGILSLILVPTRELAVQVDAAIAEYGRFCHLRSLAVYGGVSIDNQFKALRRGVDILVATPGRLLDHMQRGTVKLNKIEILVLDEADRMLDMGFIHDVRKIVAAVPVERQTMLFSATMPAEIKSLAANIQKSPKMIQIGRQHNPIETITQHVYPVPKERKIDLLIHLLRTQQMECVLVFSRTKHGADKIHHRLERAGIDSISLHSGRNQNQRQRALDGFKSGKYPVLVATDIAARGIDVEGISHVINFDVPAFAEDYIHRIGRTGRATATGDAITFVSHDEEKYLQKIQRFIGRTFQPERCDDFDYSRTKPPADQHKPKTHSGPTEQKSHHAIHSEQPRKYAQHPYPGHTRKQHPRTHQAGRPHNPTKDLHTVQTDTIPSYAPHAEHTPAAKSGHGNRPGFSGHKKRGFFGKKRFHKSKRRPL